MLKKIRKAVIPAAGFGTRFLPQTKAMPKEMLPIVDKPIIQYIVEELVEVGITDVIIVTGYHKRSIEDHFDRPSLELAENLRRGGEGKLPFLRDVERIASMASFYYVRQKGPYGNGTPLLNVRDIVGPEPFIYAWSDDFVKAKPESCFKQHIKIYEEFGCSVLSTIKAQKDEDYERYGFVGGEELRTGLLEVREIVEKPGKERSPSPLATVNGFILTPDIMDHLDEALKTRPEGKELYYNDVLKLALRQGKRILAHEANGGKYYDTGSKLEYLKTVVEFGIENQQIGAEFRKFLNDLDI
jgi:UTP--glucose-1-phosphate uridylyltransferase